MKHSLSRRRFVAGLAAVPLSAIGSRLFASEAHVQNRKVRDKGPRLEADVVEEFVRVAHSDLDKVKSMLEKQPALANSTWDWGGGDWETGLGGAAHMGRRDIALYLLDRNARLDLFAAAMLGKLAVVQATVSTFPGIHKVPGPHGIPLIAHAKKGGKHAAEVLSFLQSLDAA